jgi:hypothetical protein
MVNFITGARAAEASWSSMECGMRSSRRPWPRRIGQETRAIFVRLSKRCRSRSEVGRNGVARRAISVMLVNVLNATRPATGVRDARSMATAPPSDHPAAMIFLGSTSLRFRRCSWAASAVTWQPASLGLPPLIP